MSSQENWLLILGVIVGFIIGAIAMAISAQKHQREDEKLYRRKIEELEYKLHHH